MSLYLSIIILSLLSCSKNDILKTKVETDSKSQPLDVQSITASKGETQVNAKVDYSKVLKGFRQKYKIKKIKGYQGRLDNPLEPLPENEYVFLYTTGEIVGDLNDDVIAADGSIISAANSLDEMAAKNALLEEINTAKSYLLSSGLDFSDVYNSDDYRYIHAANLYFEIEGAEKLQNTLYASRQNTLGGCIMQAVGIKAVLDAFSKKVTKKIIIEAVAKIAKRYLGFIGTAIAIYDFIDCYYGTED